MTNGEFTLLYVIEQEELIGNNGKFIRTELSGVYVCDIYAYSGIYIVFYYQYDIYQQIRSKYFSNLNLNYVFIHSLDKL